MEQEMWKPPFARITPRDAEVEVEAPADATSLDFLQAIYRSSALPLATRMRAAVAALPFEHPKLAVTAQIDVDGDFAERLEQAILRSGLAPKIIEHELEEQLSPAVPARISRAKIP
jgi:hypothetical protein